MQTLALVREKERPPSVDIGTTKELDRKVTNTYFFIPYPWEWPILRYMSLMFASCQ